MTLDEGATHEINSRWAEYRQRNCSLMPDIYGREYTNNMTIGIQLVRDHHQRLQDSGANEWNIPQDLSNLLDQLAQKNQ
jgi:hypothetical protein